MSYLKDRYLTDGETRQLVIRRNYSIDELKTSYSHEDLTHRLLEQASDEVPVDLIRDFCAVNEIPSSVSPEISRNLPVVLIGSDELKAIFSARSDTKPDGWDRFYIRFPASAGLITVSRVGFNRQRDRAMLYVGQQVHWLAGSGEIHVFRKQDGRWVEQSAILLPAWVS